MRVDRLIAACVGVMAMTWCAASGARDEPVTNEAVTIVQKEASWPSHPSEARVLYLTAVDPETLWRRLFYTDGAGTRLVYGANLRAAEGVEESFLMDEETGDWVALGMGLPHRAPTLEGLFAASHRDDRVHETRVTLRNSAGLDLDLEVACGACEDGLGQSIGVALSLEARADLARGWSPSTKQALRHLWVSLADLHSAVELGSIEGTARETLVDVLVGSLSDSGGRDSAEGSPDPLAEPMVLEQVGKGTSLQPFAEEYLAEASFASRYLREPLRVPIPGSAFARKETRTKGR